MESSNSIWVVWGAHTHSLPLILKSQAGRQAPIISTSQTQNWKQIGHDLPKVRESGAEDRMIIIIICTCEVLSLQENPKFLALHSLTQCCEVKQKGLISIKGKCLKTSCMADFVTTQVEWMKTPCFAAHPDGGSEGPRVPGNRITQVRILLTVSLASCSLSLN